MPNYQFYARSLTAPLVIEFASDQEATSKAKQYLDGMEVEIWEGPRLVTRLSGQRYKTRPNPVDSALPYWRPSTTSTDSRGNKDTDA